MDVSNMKNIVILKNLPSNIVDEAFVVLKSNKKVKKLEKIENSKNTKSQQEVKKDKEYMLKEAEMLVSDYISKIENKQKINCKNSNQKFSKHKIWAYMATLISLIEGVILFTV